jgi:hypothetical protein
MTIPDPRRPCAEASTRHPRTTTKCPFLQASPGHLYARERVCHHIARLDQPAEHGAEHRQPVRGRAQRENTGEGPPLWRVAWSRRPHPSRSRDEAAHERPIGDSVFRDQ